PSIVLSRTKAWTSAENRPENSHNENAPIHFARGRPYPVALEHTRYFKSLQRKHPSQTPPLRSARQFPTNRALENKNPNTPPVSPLGIATTCNALPDAVTTAPSVDSLKSRHNKHVSICRLPLSTWISCTR
ncbi:hypothetical protein Smp_066420, partial [Schistosoma mansoni]|uniref:hypothetical protein n=1 Tax=Schistosoma mansoni TaxID=6183 RepID=UPI00022C8493